MFFDEKLQAEFDEKGYVAIPFLTDAEVKELYNFYLTDNKLAENYDPTYAEFSVLNAELENRRKIFNKINSIFLPRSEKILNNCRPLIANYVCKEPKKGLVPVHQNWAVVDETKYTSISIWCPLVDTSKENGTLAFVDGSHKKFRGIRGSYANSSFLPISEHIIKNYLTFMEMKAGHAIFLDDSVIHYSSPNQSDVIRLAIQLIMVPSEIKPYHYAFHGNQVDEMVDLYEVDEEYYLGMVNWRGDLSKYQKLSSFNYSAPIYSEETFKQKLHS